MKVSALNEQHRMPPFMFYLPVCILNFLSAPQDMVTST